MDSLLFLLSISILNMQPYEIQNIWKKILSVSKILVL